MTELWEEAGAILNDRAHDTKLGGANPYPLIRAIRSWKQGGAGGRAEWQQIQNEAKAESDRRAQGASAQNQGGSGSGETGGTHIHKLIRDGNGTKMLMAGD